MPNKEKSSSSSRFLCLRSVTQVASRKI